jgi:DNA-binding transcriptional LysR family regulator
VLALQQEEFRDLPVRLRILPTSELLNAIDNEIVQAGITYAPIDDPGISSIPIAKEHWVAIVPVKGKFSEVAIANIAEFKGEPVISNGADRTHPALFRKLETECVAKGFSLRAVAEINSPHEAFDLVAGKAGIAFLPAGVCEGLPLGVRAIRIADISPLEIVLIHRPDGSSFIQEFAERIRVKMSIRGRASDGHYAEPLAFPAKRKPPASAPKSKPAKLPNRSVG